MNKIYKVVWNATRGCYVVASELVKTHQGKKSARCGGSILSRAGTALLLAIAGWGAACNFIYADVTVSDQKHYGNTVTVKDIANSGKQYDITNQQVKAGNALNKFTNFSIGQKDVANLHMGEANHQINVVKNKIDIDGVVNAIKDNKIGGDVYFFSDAGIAVGATGVFNVGRLTLGTNAAYGEALYNGGMEKHLAQSAASQAKAVAGGSDISLEGKVYAQSDVVLGAGSVNVKGGEIRTHRNNADTYADKKAAEAYRNQLVKINTPSATVATALGHGDIALAAVGASSLAKPFETKGAIVIDKAYIDAAGGDTSISASAERNGGNLMGSKADASVEISNATIKGQNVAISAETKVSGKVGSADAYKTGAEEDGILGLLHTTFDEQVGNLASVVKTGADSRVTVKNSTLTAAKDLAISSKAESEIGSETGGALGVGINVGIADVSSKVEIQGRSGLTAGKDLAISAEGSNAIDLQRQGSAEDLPIAIDLGWAEAKTDASVTVAKDATLKAKENVDVSAKAERNLSVEVENSSGDGTLGLAVGVIQSETKATADVQGKVYADGKVSVSAENTVSDENGKYDPDTLHITSESESDDGTSSDPIHDIVDVATTKGKGNQLMAGIKKLWGDQSTKKKAADAGTSAADQTASTSAGGGLGLNAATAFLFSDNSAKASLAGEVRGYDEESGAGAVDVHAETLSRTKVKAGVSQGADKSAGIAAAVNYVDQNDKAEAELSGDIKSKGNVDVSAETKRPWQSNLEGFGENLADDLKTIFDPNDGFELSYLTDSWTQTGGAGEKVSGAAALNIMEYNHTAKATVKKDTKVEIDNGDLAVSAKNDIHTVNFSGDIKAPIGDQPGSLDFWEDIGGSPFSGGGKAALGGAALTVHQKNTAEATVADNVTITKAKDVSVTAENKGSNLSIAGAGGKGQTVAIDGTVNVNRFENTTKATVGKATIKADGDVSVNAEDNSKTINIGGAIAVSGRAGIGATVAYNHIDRQTEASLQGTVTSTKDVSVTAKNTGAIYAMSAAGGVTMDSTEKNGAGSTGLKAQEGADGQSTSSIGELAEKLLNAGKSDKDKKEIQKGDSALDNIAGKDASMGENVGAAKGGFAAAANVSVNRITDTAKAYTEGNMVTADALAIRSGNDSKITTGAGAIALGLSQNSQAIAGSFMYNAITDKNEAYAEDATLNLTGSEKNDTSLTVEADNAAKITNIAASGSGASKGSAVAGQISLNWVDNTTDAHVKGGSLEAGKATTISAKDQGTIDSYTGAVAVSGGGNGAAVGASIAANLIEGKTTSSLEDTTVNSGGALSVTADEASQITSIVAAGAASGKFAGAFSASGNYIHTDTDAHISNKNEMKTGALSVLAKNGSNATIGVGSAAIGGNTAGASIGVMVNQSAVSASLTGDEAKEKTITADGITVKADNAYNGDASENDQTAKTAKTVAVGFAGGTSQFAGSGSVTVNVINQTTDAIVGKGVYDAGKKAVKVEATSAAKLFGLAGGVSLSAGSGLGAAVDVQTYKGHTYAGIADGASLKNASSVTVNAESAEHMTSIAAAGAGGAGSFAGAGAAGAHSIATVTKAYIGEQSEVTDAGDVSVTAKDETKLNTIAGSGAASGNTGVGLTAAVEVVNKKASAIVGDDAKVTGSSLTVKAENTSSSVTSAAGLGVGGTAGLAGAASETFVNQETDAHVGKNANVTVEKGAKILANSNFTQGATAGSVGGGGTVGIGISNATVSLHAVTKAYADDGAVISGGNQVKISADHTTNLTYATVAGGIGGTVGVSGNAAVNIIDTETKAYTGKKSALSADEADEAGDGISITASDTTELHGGNGGAAIGISGGGAGVAVGVTNLKKNTSAYADQNAKLDSQGQVAISAKNAEDIDNVTVQVAGGTYAGLAGAVNVMNLSASTKAYTDTGVQINQANKASGRYGGNVSVKADHNLNMTSAVGGAAASGGASGGAAVDVANIKTQTNAYIGDSNTIDTKGDVSASAKDEVTLNSHAYAASIGAVGLSGSISVYSIGSASFDDKDGILTGKNAKGQDEDLTTWVNGQVNQSQTGDAMKAYDGKTGALSDVKKKLDTTYESQAPTTEEKGTLAKIGKGTTITADGNVSVDAADTLNMKNNMSSITGSAFASAGASVSVVNTDTQTKALIDSDAKIAAGKDLAVKSKAAHKMDQIITGASVSCGVSGQGTVATWNDRSDVSALIGASRGIQANNVTVTSDNDRTLEANVAGASVALGAVNGSVIVANTSGSSTAGVGDESKANTAGEGVTAQKDITISANADTNLDATAIGAAAGVFAGDGTGVRLSSDTDAKAFVGKKEKLRAGRDLSVTAKNTPKISALSTSAAVGLAGVGITVAMASSDDSAHVSVGDGAALTAGEALTLKAEMAKPTDGKNINAHAIAGGGGVVSGAVADVRVNLDQHTDVSIGEKAALKGKTADVSAVHQSTSALAMESVAAGYYSGTGGETRFSETSGVSVSVGDGTTIETEDETRILAENQTEKAQTATSGGAALATGAGIVNETTIRHTTAVDLGEVAIHANASALTEAEKAAGKTLFDKNAIAIDAASHVTSKDQDVIATGSAVGAAHVKNAHHVTAETTTSVAKGASLLAGDTEEIKKEHKNEDLTNTEDKTYGKTYRGGSIGVGSKNDADLTGTTMVDVFGAAGYAGTSNEVTYDGKTKTAFGGEAETAKGDIRVASGRDSAGTIGQLNVKAKSDILNATAIPISSKKDPFAKISSDAALSMNGTLLADRDIYLQSTAGESKATGSGEVKDWVNKVGEVFGTEGGSIGKSEVTTKATAALDGKAETGIHRNKSITIGGTDNGGTWNTSVTTKGDIDFTLSKPKPASETLSKRLAELKKELADHISDPAAKASYEAEIAFVESKMIEQGLGYRVKDKDGNFTFVEIDPGTKTEYDETKTMLDGMTASKDAVLEAIQKDQAAVQVEKDKMTAMGTAHTAYETAKKETTSAENAKTQAETAFNAAENALKDKIKTSTADSPITNPTQNDIDAYIKKHGTEKEVTDYQTTKAANDKAAGVLTNAQAKEAEAKTTYETAVKTAGYDPANMNEEKIRADWKALSDLQTAYANSDKTIKEDIDKLTKQVNATENFKAQGGTERDGKFYRADGSEVEGGKWNGETLLHIIAYPHMTRDVTIEDTVSQLGDIYLEGDAITGSGTLTAHGDAKVEVKNESPNNLILGDIKVMGKESNGQIGQGGAFYLNGNAMKGTEQLGNLTLKGRRQPEDPSVTISNTFNPNTYTKDVGEGEKAPVYTAANLQLGKGKTIYNTRGKVTVVSDYGDVYNDGSIVAGSVELTAKNGDFIQSYSNRIANIGGDPFVEDKDHGGFKKNEALGSGILANGNIFISARYVNINAKIQSGIANWSLEIPENLTFYYKKGDQKIPVTLEKAKNLGKDHTIYVGNATGNMAENLTYDVETGRLVLGQTEVHGGKVSIVGTIINTTEDTSKARIEALDGYGSMTIDNKSKLDLELKGLSTGEGVEGVIEITDLDPKKGTPSRKTTYTRKDGNVHMLVQQYQNGSWTSGTENTFDGTYKPSADQHYVFQTGTDKSTTNTYEYHGDKFDWWGIENKTPTRDELIAMGAKLTNTVTGEEKALINGTFISGSTNTIGNGQMKEWDVLNKSDVIDYSIKTKRRWYTIGLTKKYDMKMVIRDYETHIKQYETDASHAIGIRFNGDENGGRIDINQKDGAGNVAIAGTISNVGGATAISGDAITQSKNGFLHTDSLALTAKSDVGGKEQAILTDAKDVSGSAKAGSFYLKSSAADVSVGDIEAAKTVSLTSEGSLTQKADAMVKGSRVDLTAETGTITGENGSDFRIQTTPKSGEDYGLKASADGDIAITNTGGNLYLDSVTSKHGDITLTTEGSFIDNNFGEVTDESAKEKLLGWANAAVLEGSKATVEKQKTLLKAKVESKYNEYQSLAAYVKDGKYTLDETAKAALVKEGKDVDAYASEKQKRYDELKGSVGAWTKDGVEAYLKSIDNSKEAIYGKASLKADSLTGDTYLTKEEKAEILARSAKSAQDLLVTFSPGGIKEGITDTQATLKGTPHVSGKNVTLTASGGKTGENASGIGHKENGQEIDLSAGNLNNLTAQELLALAAAERGDFKVNGNKVTVSSIHSIEANAGGILTAKADKGAIYLQSAGAVNTGSSLTAAGEVRLKAKGHVNGVTIGSSEQTVIESGSGKIDDVTVTGTGVLTARAKDGVSLKKSDGDLVINTVYASEGDVRLDVGENSLLAEDGHDTSGDETGTTYTNVEGENITIANVKNIKGASDGASLGMKVTGTKAEDGSTVPGSIRFHATGDADITLFGEAASDATSIEAESNLTITSRGNISNGNYQARKALRVHTAQNNTISGGNFSGGTADITNAGKMSGGTYTAKETMGITNQGTIENGKYTAHGDLTYTDTAGASLTDGTLISKEGKAQVTAHGVLQIKKLSAKDSATVEADHDVTLTEAEAGTLAISSGGSVNAGTLTATTGDAKITAKKDVTIGTLDVKEHAELTSGGDMVLHEAEAGGTLTADAGGSISVKGTDAKISAADITMHAGEDIRITDRSPVGKLDGVDTSTPAGSTTGSGAAGSLVIGEAKPHDFDASRKGSALLSSAGGKVTLSAKKVEIDTLVNGEGNAADLKISADNIGIDDLAGTGAQHVTIHGKDGQSQAHYAGIHSTAEGGTLVKDSAVEHLELTGREPLGLSNTAIGGDSLLATDKIRVTIQKNPGSSQAEHFGNLSLSGYDIATDHVMTSVKDGLTVNGERFPVTAENVMNASLYEDRTLGRDGREKEEETEKESPSLAFGAPNDKEAYEVVK